MARQKHSAAHENHERWLLTYADMITLLVAFFIMLYAMSVMNQHKFEQVAISVRSGFGGQVKPGATSILEGAGSNPAFSIFPGGRDNPGHDQKSKSTPGEKSNRSLDTQTQRAYSAIVSEIQSHHLEKLIKIRQVERGIVVTIVTDNFLFNRGQADLRRQSLWVLDAICKPLRELKNQIRVEGHTDDLPIHTIRFPSNWELSTGRATNVLRYMLDRGQIPADRLSASGYADTRPTEPNDTEQHRAKNRRVDIVILQGSSDDLGGPHEEG